MFASTTSTRLSDTARFEDEISQHIPEHLCQPNVRPPGCKYNELTRAVGFCSMVTVSMSLPDEPSATMLHGSTGQDAITSSAQQHTERFYYGHATRGRQELERQRGGNLCHAACRKHQSTYLHCRWKKLHINDVCETVAVYTTWSVVAEFSYSVMRMRIFTLLSRLHTPPYRDVSIVCVSAITDTCFTTHKILNVTMSHDTVLLAYKCNTFRTQQYCA